ncbi:MAG TPA: Crp/Fnr family transcriptional regulator [Acidobacteriaceae bacterium]|nr:Crp/Fnr family transcriptional regulator [Acidobacteriaceae bacterium]
MNTSKVPGGLFRNAILAKLEESTLERLRLTALPRVKAVQYLFRPSQPMDRVFFLESGFASITVPLSDGTSVSAGILGNRSLIGVEALLGSGPCTGWHEAVTQSPSEIYSSTVEDARREFQRGGLFHHLAMEDLRIQLLHTTQLSACNTRHDVEHRLCRWLLLCHDQTEMSDIFVTHDALAKAIGICRSTATMAVDILRRDGVLHAGRAHISIVNRPALEARACECYAVMRSMESGSRLLEGLHPEKRPPTAEHFSIPPARPASSNELRGQVALAPNLHVQ